MKIVDIAVKKVYRFNCPNCQSRLEADSKEVVDIGGKVCKFHCPVCRKERYIAWSDMRKKIVYAANKYGWTDIAGCRAVRVRDGYILKLPKPTPL